MPANRDRQRAVREGVEMVLALEAEQLEPPYVEDAPRTQTLSEALAVLVAELRASGDDEALGVEICLKSIKPKLDKQTLLEAALTMRALRYNKIVPVLMRVARSAPSRERRMTRFASRHR